MKNVYHGVACLFLLKYPVYVPDKNIRKYGQIYVGQIQTRISFQKMKLWQSKFNLGQEAENSDIFTIASQWYFWERFLGLCGLWPIIWGRVSAFLCWFWATLWLGFMPLCDRQGEEITLAGDTHGSAWRGSQKGVLTACQGTPQSQTQTQLNIWYKTDILSILVNLFLL